MTTTYELYTNENGIPKAVEGKAPAILERVETLEETLDKGVVTSVNGKTGVVSLDVGVTSFNGSKGAVTYSAPVSSVNGKTGAVTVDVGVTSVNGKTGAVTVSVPPTPKAYVTETWKSGAKWYRKWSDGWIEQGGIQGAGVVTFPKAFSNTNYTMTAMSIMLNANAGSIDICYSNKGTTNIDIQLRFAGRGQSGFEFMWYACGY